MSSIELAAIGGLILACLGMILTSLKISRDQGDRDGRIETKIQNLNQKMDTFVVHQEKISKAIQDQAKFCSGFSSRVDQRVIALEKEIFSR